MSLPQKRILLVDDDPDFCGAIETLLTMSDFQVTQSDSVTEALDQARNERFDLLILDSRIQGGSGLELCTRIRDFDEATPILFCSGDAYETDKEKGLKAGAQVYLTKPVDFDDLIREVQRLAPSNSQ